MKSNEKVRATTYTKDGKSWKECHETTNPETVYKKLLDDMISKKLNACLYIRKIERVNLYNGFNRITVYYDNGVKTDYIIDRA